MSRRGLAQGVINALPEPAFMLTPAGVIIGANRAARAMVGDRAVDRALSDHLLTPRDQVERYLARCRSTTTPMPGALVFRATSENARYRVHCARLSGPADEVVLLLRCLDPRGDRFSLLAERVRQLDAELRERVREKALLSEALDENVNLMRELQHRVKNNIQMMISLLSMSALNTCSPEVRSFVNDAKDRFRALATTQDLIYEARSASVVRAGDLFGRLTRALAESADGVIEIDTAIDNVWLAQETAHCLALIVNELVTNSIKHGAKGGAGRVCVSLKRQDGHVRMAVQDDGPGYPSLEDLPRSSGLTLVRGLCRQIGAGLDLGNEVGAMTVVTFAHTSPAEAEVNANAEQETGGRSDRDAVTQAPT